MMAKKLKGGDAGAVKELSLEKKSRKESSTRRDSLKSYWLSAYGGSNPPLRNTYFTTREFF